MVGSDPGLRHRLTPNRSDLVLAQIRDFNIKYYLYTTEVLSRALLLITFLFLIKQ